METSSGCETTTGPGRSIAAIATTTQGEGAPAGQGQDGGRGMKGRHRSTEGGANKGQHTHLDVDGAGEQSHEAGVRGEG